MNEDEIYKKVETILRKEFGNDWLKVAQMIGTQNLRKRAGKDLTSFLAFPERGNGGDNTWRGNCSPSIVESLVKYALEDRKRKKKDNGTFTVLDPMSGSGTTGAVAERMGVKSYLYDLNPNAPKGKGSWDALKDDVDDSADLIFLHPPYHSIIKYSGQMWGAPHKDDLSRCENYLDFIDKLNLVIKKLFLSLRKGGRMALLVGDIRMKGEFHSIQHDVMRMGDFESFIVKAQYNCMSDARTYNSTFIPIVTEYILMCKKPDAFLIPFSARKQNVFDISRNDTPSLTWNHLIRMTMEHLGGKAKLMELYEFLSHHPKAKANEHYKERIRATLYEHKDQYIPSGNATYSLSYNVE